MKKLFILFFIMLSVNCFAAGAKKTTLLENLSSIKTFSAEFKQVNTLKDFGDDEYTGKVYIKMKEKALWDYEEPYSSWYLITEKNVDYYDEINNQLVKMDANNMKEHILLQVLMDFQKIKSTFNVTEKNSMLIMKPKTNTGIIYINILFNKNVIEKLQSKDNNGNTTEIIFSKVSIDKNLNDKIFNKKIPKDTNIIKQ